MVFNKFPVIFEKNFSVASFLTMKTLIQHLNLTNTAFNEFSITSNKNNGFFLKIYHVFRACLNEIRSKLKPLWNVVSFTRPTFRPQTPFKNCGKFHCGNVANHNKILIYMGKWELLINASLINVKQMLR